MDEGGGGGEEERTTRVLAQVLEAPLGCLEEDRAKLPRKNKRRARKTNKSHVHLVAAGGGGWGLEVESGDLFFLL
jgi:hypothetical protein